MVTWKNFQVDTTSWVPASSVNDAVTDRVCNVILQLHIARCIKINIYRYYTSPVVPDRIVRHKAHAFIDNIDKSLSVGHSRRNTLYIKFSHDVYRMLFGSKTSINEGDFCSRYFC